MKDFPAQQSPPPSPTTQIYSTSTYNMVKITKEAALLYHSQGKPGKIEVVPTKPYRTQTDLSLA